MQNFFLRLQKYDFQLEYAPDKTMLVSAWRYNAKLSQSYLNDVNPEFDENILIWHVHFILSNLLI